MPDVPTVPFSTLPEATSTTGLDVVGVKEGTAVKAAWSALTSDMWKAAETAPTSSESSGNSGEVYVEDGALWTTDVDGAWGVSPRFTSEKGKADVTGTTRFLRVDAAAAGLYNETEKANARANIGLGVASTAALGLVKDSSSAPAASAPVRVSAVSGGMHVGPATYSTYGVCRLIDATISDPAPDAVATYSWVMAKFSGLSVDEYGKLKAAAIPRATYEVVGGIIPDATYFDLNTATGRLSSRLAAYSTYGVSKAIDYSTWSGYSGNPADTSVVPTYAVVAAMTEAVRTYPASYSTPGTVKLSPMMTLTSGALGVRTAGVQDKGVVSVTTSPTGTTGDTANVLSTDATYDLIDAKLAEAFSSYEGRIATASVPGYVAPSSQQFSISSSGALTIRTATSSVVGAVRLYAGTDPEQMATSSPQDAASVASVYAVYSTTQTKLGSLTAQLGTLPSRFSSVQAQIGIIPTQYSSLQAQFSALYQTFSGTYSALEARVAALEEKQV